MLAKFTVKTIGRNQLIDITPQIKKIMFADFERQMCMKIKLLRRDAMHTSDQ